MNTKKIYFPFKFYNENYIYGSLQIFIFNKWVSPYYLNDKNVRKICSFFYRNFGTISLYKFFKNVTQTDLIETINCPLNASHIESCVFYEL